MEDNKMKTFGTDLSIFTNQTYYGKASDSLLKKAKNLLDKYFPKSNIKTYLWEDFGNRGATTIEFIIIDDKYIIDFFDWDGDVFELNKHGLASTKKLSKNTLCAGSVRDILLDMTEYDYTGKQVVLKEKQ